MKFCLSLVVALATVLAAPVSGKDTPGGAKPKRQRRNRKLSQFSGSDILEDKSKDDAFYQRSYTTVTLNDATNFYGGVKDNSSSSRGILGTAFSTSASVYGMDSVVVEPNNQFVGGLEATFIPQPNKDFFFQGTCKVTRSGSNTNSILAHSCIYDLCLGGGGFSCINLYAGTAFDFTPTSTVGGGTPILEKPPTFPLFILGGTGRFYLIQGAAQLETVAGRTAFNPVAGGGQPPQEGTITQMITLWTNAELPPAP